MRDVFIKIEQGKVEAHNASIAEPDGTEVVCNRCNNRGTIAFLNEYEKFAVRPCKCSGTRLTMNRLQRQGLFDSAKEKTLEKFTVSTDLQRDLKHVVERYIEDVQPKWLVLSGQSGSGKTHLCTAAFVQISLHQGIDGRYLLWNSDGRRIKAASKDGDDSLLNDFKQAGLLYIDDLFKCKRGTDPSDADVRLAFELLDYRYSHKLRTIISTEMLLNDIRDLDEAIYRRIREMCGEYIGNIGRDPSKIYTK